MDMALVNMRSHDESMATMGETHSQLIPQFISKLRCNFSRFECLANMICEYVMPTLIPSGDTKVLLF